MRARFYTILLVTIVCISSCSNWRLKIEASIFMMHKIDIPKVMLALQDGCEEYKFINRTKPLLVIYYDSSVCVPCNIERLEDSYSRLISYADSLDSFSIAIILAPDVSERESLIHFLENRSFPFPVYIDNEFNIKNQKVIPDNELLQCFLINQKGKPLYVGYPITENGSLSEKFINTLTNHINP